MRLETCNSMNSDTLLRATELRQILEERLEAEWEHDAADRALKAYEAFKRGEMKGYIIENGVEKEVKYGV
ncbi:hypothetical protein [Testudinibacter sp. TR-2022]|uniref:hypothetical protein n=1 Tax=Testudinibacter sp. TR-2022 TaxID=2585029 RepID=UPI001118395A|nr:hypothetical protein [Testudinibacter sp. TR-2022]TNH06523.1 hypothetical protein FHQ30_07675 [Pasteurellaceae bacterium Phil11]TNH22545.1 hypothetical protein FHQ29_07325 [Testudinibacter sp. TR-2022]TNH26515.1 hypothetical protein FHQ27_07350 [Testudinibacter sp. TR-2022]